jgi:hypothetical protein
MVLSNSLPLITGSTSEDTSSDNDALNRIWQQISQISQSDSRIEKLEAIFAKSSSSQDQVGKGWKPWVSWKPRLLAFQLEGKSDPVEFKDVASLAIHLGRVKQAKNPRSRSVYLLEGLSNDLIGVLSEHFQLHPSMFADHERLLPFEGRITGEGGGLPFLPSAVFDRGHVTFKYHEAMVLSKKPSGFSGLCATSGRHFAVTRLMGELSDVVVVRRKCTYWSMKTESGGWICMSPVFTFMPLSKH